MGLLLCVAVDTGKEALVETVYMYLLTGCRHHTGSFGIASHAAAAVDLVMGTPLSPFLTGRMFVRSNILRTLRRTMIRFLIEHLLR